MDKSRLVIIIVILFLIIFTITGCNILSGNTNEEAALILEAITDQYNEALEELEYNRPSKAKEILNDIDKNYINYPIKDDINGLIVKVDERISIQEEADVEISKIDTLIKEHKFSEAKLLISLVDRSILHVNQKDKLIELYEKINTATAIVDSTSEVATDDN